MKKYKILKHDKSYYDKCVAKFCRIDKDEYANLSEEEKERYEKEIIKALSYDIEYPREVELKKGLLLFAAAFNAGALYQVCDGLANGFNSGNIGAIGISATVGCGAVLMSALFQKIGINMENKKIEELYEYFTSKQEANSNSIDFDTNSLGGR